MARDRRCERMLIRTESARGEKIENTCDEMLDAVVSSEKAQTKILRVLRHSQAKQSERQHKAFEKHLPL